MILKLKTSESFDGRKWIIGGTEISCAHCLQRQPVRMLRDIDGCVTAIEVKDESHNEDCYQRGFHE